MRPVNVYVGEIKLFVTINKYGIKINVDLTVKN